MRVAVHERAGTRGGSMTDHPLVHEQTPVEYFKELVESSLSRQRVRAGDLTEFYLVNLLCQYVRPDASPQLTDEEAAAGVSPGASARERGLRTARPSAKRRGFLPLHVRLLLGQLRPPLRRRRLLPVPGGVRLRLAEPIGGRGVRRSLRASCRRSSSDSWMCLPTSATARPWPRSTDVMRIYEKWLRTGSERDGQRLVERGILPNHSIGRRFIQ